MSKAGVANRDAVMSLRPGTICMKARAICPCQPGGEYFGLLIARKRLQLLITTLKR